MIAGQFTVNSRDTNRLKQDFGARAEKAALKVTDRAARIGKEQIREGMRSAGLGRLGFAIDAGSDLKKSGVTHKSGAGFSASGWIFIRSRSQRTIGAIVSYTEGAQILPRRGKYLWIPTDQIKRLVGLPTPSTGGGRGKANFRLTPRLWDRTHGRKFGPLIFLRSNTGTPMLVIRDATVSASGAPRSVRARTKTGKIPKGQVAREIIPAFIGIPNTTRQARLDPNAIAQRVVREMLDDLGVEFNVSVA